MRLLRRLVLLSLLGTLGCAAHAPGASDNTLRIFLARHGQSDWNLERRIQGQTDRELNDTGRDQAASLAKLLHGTHLDRVYSSTLRRSRETAEIARGDAPLESLPGLAEQGVGKFEGLRVDGSEPEAQAEYERRSADPTDRLDGGESFDEFYERVRRTMETLRSRHRSGTILIVGHGGTNAQILRALLGLTLEESRAIRQANDELYLIELAKGAEPHVFKLVPRDKLREL